MIKVNIQIDREDLPSLMGLLKDSGPDTEISVTVTDQGVPAPAGHADAASIAETREGGADSVLDQAALEKLEAASPHIRPFLKRFMEHEVQERHAQVITGLESTNYVRLYVPGPQRLGAYCYVKPGYLDFRLPARYAEGCQFAFPRNVKDGNTYAVRLRLQSPFEDALDEARKLAEKAFERTLTDAKD
jgi:hypothetical protein